MDVSRENQEMCLPIFSFSHYFDNSTNVPVHTHPATELIYLVGGQCTVTIGKEKFLCTPGDLLVIPPETAHNQVSDGPVKTVFVTAVIDARLLSSRTRLIHFGNDPWTPRLMNMIQEMSREVRYELCGGVLYSLVRHIAQFERDQEFGTRNRIVTRAIKLIEANFNRPLNTKLIARSVGVSESYLRAVFLREKRSASSCSCRITAWPTPGGFCSSRIATSRKSRFSAAIPTPDISPGNSKRYISVPRPNSGSSCRPAPNSI